MWAGVLWLYAAGIAGSAFIYANYPSIIMGPEGLSPAEVVKYQWDIVNHFGTSVVLSSHAVLLLVPVVLLGNYTYKYITKKPLVNLEDITSLDPITPPCNNIVATQANSMVEQILLSPLSSHMTSHMTDVLVLLSQFPY